MHENGSCFSPLAGNLRRHGLGVNELAIASPGMVALTEYHNIGDRARYPLVKAHGEIPPSSGMLDVLI